MLGFLATLAAGISTVVTAVTTAITTLSTTIGPAIVSFGEKLTTIIAKIPEIRISDIIEFTNKIGKFVSVILDVLGINIQDKPEELGQKMIDADKKLSDFDNDVEAYIKYLNEEIKLDKEKMKDLKPEEILLRQDLAIGLEVKAIGEKLDVDIPPELLVTYMKLDCMGKPLDPLQAIKIIESLKKEGVENFKDISDYLEVNGKIDTIDIGNKLRNSVNDALGITDSKEIICEAQKEIANFDANKI